MNQEEDVSILDRSWPVDGLEHVKKCPVCDEENRTLLHSDLTDRIFFAAPGKWTMWRCVRCRSAYLDPRPTPETIGLAYANYYTHAEHREHQSSSWIEWLRNSLGNDYRNARFNTRLRPAIPFVGRRMVRLFPHIRRRIELEYRCLPRWRKQARLLDIGCGNGEFLYLVRRAGWQIAGVEPDNNARKIAKDSGIAVRPSLRDWEDAKDSFDFATASHVIEHVHDPRQFLCDIHDLLRPQGRLYIQTPNIDASTHQRFGKYWRGLEPPRHLVLFTRQSLVDALGKAGFRVLQYIDVPEAEDFLVEQSRAIAEGISPQSCLRVSEPPPAAIALQLDNATNAEFLTLVAEKCR